MKIIKNDPLEEFYIFHSLFNVHYFFLISFYKSF